MPETVQVRFEPGGATVWVEKGTTALQAARQAGQPIDAPCAGRGVCGGCGVRVTDGSLAPPDEAELGGLRRAPGGVRLACRAIVDAPVTLRAIVPHTAHAVTQPVYSRIGDTDTGTRSVAAVDLGTSTVAGVVVESATRIEVGRGTVLNRQSMWGADVLSRIAAAQEGDADQLKEAAEASILDALRAACSEEGRCLGSIERLVIAGNSAMASLLLGLEISGLASHPFTAPYSGIERLSEGSAIVSALAEGAQALVLPPLAGFVGGDVLAGLIAEGIAREGSGLYLDLGTNAEVVRAGADGLVVASAAAGPAFEAGGISSGGPAAQGAVQSVSFAPDSGLVLDVIGGAEPGWLCGSGLVSVIALLLRLGHMTDDGLLLPHGPLGSLFFDDQGVRSLRIAAGAGVDGPITLTQLDVRAFQLAKAAVRTAIEMVVRGHTTGAVGDVIIAGGFGSALALADLEELGVLPAEYIGRTRIVGNAALLGATMIAMDPELEGQLRGVEARVEHVELALNSGFAGRYMEGLRFGSWSLEAEGPRRDLT